MMSNAESMNVSNLMRNADWTPAYNRMFDSLRDDENIFRKQEIIYVDYLNLRGIRKTTFIIRP